MKSEVQVMKDRFIILGLLLTCIFILLLIPNVNAVSIAEIKSFLFPSSGDTNIVYNNSSSYFYQTTYTINVQALTSSPADNAVNYFGMKPSAFTTTAGQNKIYFRKAGNITGAEIYTYSGTAGTNQTFNVSIYKNGDKQVSKGFIADQAVATNQRIFSNRSLSVPIINGDYIELAFQNPNWVTNPLTTITGGYIEVSP
jgi:hypothetical protein